ncbi:hypothetical protein L195_g058268, partial [Trifolium pratense]
DKMAENQGDIPIDNPGVNINDNQQMQMQQQMHQQMQQQQKHMQQQQQEFMMQMMQKNQQFMQQHMQGVQPPPSLPHNSSQEADERKLRRFLKMNPSPFSGTTDPLVAQNWLKEMKKAFK